MKGDITMLTISLYSISKRINSTKQPSTPIETVSGMILEDCDILSPTIVFGRPKCGMAFNYIKCNIDSDKDRYFWVTSRTILEDGRYMITCVQDNYATWKSQLNAQSFQLVKAPTQGGDKFGTDSDVLFGEQMVREVQQLQDGVFTSTFNGGVYVIGINKAPASGDISFKAGTCNYIVATPSDAIALLDKLSETEDWITDVQPIQNIVSVMYFPFSIPNSGSTNITWQWKYRTGDFKTDVSLTGETTQFKFSTATLEWLNVNKFPNVTNAIYTLTSNFTTSAGSAALTLSKHPASTNNTGSPNFKWVDRQPYVRHMISFGPFGQFEIPLNAESSTNTSSSISHLSYTLNVDLITGMGRLIVYDNLVTSPNAHILLTKSAQVGIPVYTSSNMSQSRLSILDASNSYSSAMSSLGANMISSATGGAGNMWQGNTSIRTGNYTKKASRANQNALAGATTLQGVGTIAQGFVSHVNARAAYTQSMYAASLPTSLSSGANGSFLDVQENIYFYAFEYLPILYYNTSKYGYLNDGTNTIGSLGNGYYRTVNADFAATGATSDEIAALNEQLNSGIYYE